MVKVFNRMSEIQDGVVQNGNRCQLVDKIGSTFQRYSYMLSVYG